MRPAIERPAAREITKIISGIAKVHAGYVDKARMILGLAEPLSTCKVYRSL